MAPAFPPRFNGTGFYPGCSREATCRWSPDLSNGQETRDFVDAVRAGCQRVTQDFIFPTGGVPEYFDRAYNRDEGCSEADWIRVNFLLWRATGDTAYLDAADHALRNHMIPMRQEGPQIEVFSDRPGT